MTDQEQPYQPIPCAVYSEYELAIIQQQKLQLIWQEPGAIQHISRLLPFDLITENHAEYLLATDHEEQEYKIRLDYIQQYRILA